ncbi:hypothetical protein [Methylobacterium sp. Gmos1]
MEPTAPSKERTERCTCSRAGLGKGGSYAVARVELIAAVPDGSEVNHDAVETISRARASGIPVEGGGDGR